MVENLAVSLVVRSVELSVDWLVGNLVVLKGEN